MKCVCSRALECNYYTCSLKCFQSRLENAVVIYNSSCFVFGDIHHIHHLITTTLLVNSHLSSCRYATPFGLTSEYAHPAEILFLGFATIFGPAITGPHLLTLWIWMSLRVIETVEAHCGYDFPWSLSRYLPIYGGYVISSFLKFVFEALILSSYHRGLSCTTS